jgi:hypothetical protein
MTLDDDIFSGCFMIQAIRIASNRREMGMHGNNSKVKSLLLLKIQLDQTSIPVHLTKQATLLVFLCLTKRHVYRS